MDVSFRGYEDLMVRTVKIGKGAKQKTGYAISGKFNNIDGEHLKEFTEGRFFDLFKKSPNPEKDFSLVFSDKDGFVSLNNVKLDDIIKSTKHKNQTIKLFDTLRNWVVDVVVKSQKPELETQLDEMYRIYNILSTGGKTADASKGLLQGKHFEKFPLYFELLKTVQLGPKRNPLRRPVDFLGVPLNYYD